MRPVDACEERGFAMIIVMLGSVVALALSAIAIARGQNELGEALDDRRFQAAVHVAEAGLDDALFRLARDHSWDTGETVPVSFGSVEEEREWALEAAGARAVTAVPGGEWVTVKPVNADRVYSVGYVPARANVVKTRVLRVEYDFAPFAPVTAIISGGHLKISGNPVIQGANGSVHANGNFTISGNPSTTGYLAATGSYNVSGNPTVGDPANTGGSKPEREVPQVDARHYYELSEYDLCNDGLVRGGPAYPGPEANATGTPCMGGVLDDATSDEYRGWKMGGTDSSKGAKWDFAGNQAFDGVYYLYRGSAKVSGNPGSLATPWSVTILTEASATGSEPGHCPHTAGDIEISGNPVMRPFDSAQPLLLIAGRDLEMSGNPISGNNFEGFLYAHEQFKINGNPRMTASLVAGDGCDSSGSGIHDVEISGDARITYDGTMELPSGNVPRATLWEEM